MMVANVREFGRILVQPPSAGGPRPQHVARSSWCGAFLSFSTSYVAADRDGPRSGSGGVKKRPASSRAHSHP